MLLREDGGKGRSQRVLVGLCFLEVDALGGVVRLDLRLGAGGTDHDGLAVFKAVGEDVGLRKTGLFGFEVVGDLRDRDAGDVLRRVLTERCHHAGHLVHTGEAGELEGPRTLARE